jgi:hypothetical protein
VGDLEMLESSPLQPEIKRLTKLLDRLAKILEPAPQWQARVTHDADLLRQGDPAAITDFLNAFGGMGSLNDLIFTPMNGNARSSREGHRRTKKLRRVASEAYALADEIRRDALEAPGS